MSACNFDTGGETANDRKILVFAVTAVIILILFDAAAILIGNDGSRNEGQGALVGDIIREDGFPNEKSRLWVYGNANEDDYINEEDLTALRMIIEGVAEPTVLADANADGKVNEEDLAYLERILRSENISVYYIDNYYTVSEISWPVNTIAIGYCSGAYTADVTGLCGKVVGVDTTIKDYWHIINPVFGTADSWGTHESPNYESLIISGTDVFVPGYCVEGTDEKSKTYLESAGINVMFISTSDNSGVDYPNDHIDRSILMFAYLLQGDMEKTYDYLGWHDRIVSVLESAASLLSDDEKASMIMARGSPFYINTGQYSITGKDNTNNIHAEKAGVNAVGQHSEFLTKNYNNRTAEDILALIDSESNNGIMFYVDNAHDGIRKQYDLDDCIRADAEMLKNSKNTVHYLGMAREAGNSPLYVVEMAFYQYVMYPQLREVTNLDYRDLFAEYFEKFSSHNYAENLDIDDFFKDYGVL